MLPPDRAVVAVISVTGVVVTVKTGGGVSVVFEQEDKSDTDSINAMMAWI